MRCLARFEMNWLCSWEGKVCVQMFYSVGLVFNIGYFCKKFLFFIMESISLEDEDPRNMFITQESRNIVPLVPNFEEEEDPFFRIEIDNAGVGNAALRDPQYSDISEDDFEIPSSQAQVPKRPIEVG